MSDTLPDAATVRARHAEGPSGNVAVADTLLPLAPPEALAQVVAAASGLPRWSHAGTRGEVAWLTRRTRIFRFTDDIHVLAEAAPGGSRLLLRSASRVGRSDLGQNARNLRELLDALERHRVARAP